MATKPAPRYLPWGIKPKPIQLIKGIWGLGKDKHCIALTLIDDDSILMDMDAPLVMPAGSQRREETKTEHGPIYYWAIQSVILRQEA